MKGYLSSPPLSLPPETAPKIDVLFYKVTRNRNEIEAKKTQIFDTDEKKKEK